MKKQKGYTIIEMLFIPILFLIIAAAVAWCINLVQLADCDFDPKKDYKCEIIHGLGVFPMISLGTIWFGTDEQ